VWALSAQNVTLRVRLRLRPLGVWRRVG
jgi:hypothetical protein